MVTAAVLWALVGLGFGVQGATHVASAGDTLAGVGQMLIGLAAVVAALASLWVGRKAKNNSAEAVRALGPANGVTVQELLHRNQVVLDEIKGFEDYQHQRNHDVLNALARANSATPVLLRLCERLLDRLEREEND